MEKLLNNYIKISPIKFDSFVASEKESYEAVGIVLDVADGINIPIGSKIFFDSFMCKKYPVIGKTNEFEWYVAYDEVVKYELTE